MDYGSQGPTATAISIVFAVITAIVISLRLFSRIYIVRSTGLDDSKLRQQHIRHFKTDDCVVLMVIAAVSFARMKCHGGLARNVGFS